MIDYKFKENEILEEVSRYIDSTYDEHYATGKIQATESIIDDGHGTGFCMGNVGKYGRRYGKKGETPAEWRKDLMKVMHYTIIQLFIHDQEHSIKSSYDIRDSLLTGSIDEATPEEWNQVGIKKIKEIL